MVVLCKLLSGSIWFGLRRRCRSPPTQSRRCSSACSAHAGNRTDVAIAFASSDSCRRRVRSSWRSSTACVRSFAKLWKSLFRCAEKSIVPTSTIRSYAAFISSSLSCSLPINTVVCVYSSFGQSWPGVRRASPRQALSGASRARTGGIDHAERNEWGATRSSPQGLQSHARD